MSRFHNRNFELLEPYDAKVSRTVLRGEGSSNAPDLLDVFLDNHAETLKSLEARARNMNSLARYSRANSVNKEWIDLYLNEAHTEGYRSVRCHCNVLIWADSETELKGICNDVGSQLALMAARLTAIRSMCRRSSGPAYRVPRASFPPRSAFPTSIRQALCFLR